MKAHKIQKLKQTQKESHRIFTTVAREQGTDSFIMRECLLPELAPCYVQSFREQDPEVTP